MLQLYPVYSLWNRCKTLTRSPDPKRANGTNKPCILLGYARRTVPTLRFVPLGSEKVETFLCSIYQRTTGTAENRLI